MGDTMQCIPAHQTLYDKYGSFNFVKLLIYYISTLPNEASVIHIYHKMSGPNTHFHLTLFYDIFLFFS